MDLYNLINYHLESVEKLCTLGNTKYSGYLDKVENFETFQRDLKASGFSFYTRRSDGKSKSITGRILFSSEKKNAEINIPFFGSPFLTEKISYLRCSQDGRYEPRPAQQDLATDHPPSKKRRTANSKKVGCLASMYVKRLRVFNEECYTLRGPNQRANPEKAKIMKKLREDLSSAAPPTGVLRYFVVISAAEEHNHSIVSTNQNQTLNTQLKKEIRSVVMNNPCSVKDMKMHLDEVVRTMFDGSNCPAPDRSNRCYYPSDIIIRSHMNQALYKIKKISYDQEALEERITTWMAEYPKDTFFFRPQKVPVGDSAVGDFVEEPPGSTILFCHQTEWQRDLLNRYGNDISLLDATYKTCNYSLPLFFIVVKTNSGYSVVGTFVVQSDSRALIGEALSQFKQWNPDWVPKYFLTDLSEAEINAVVQTFPDATVYVCAFHREQSWNKWLNKHGHVKKKKSVAPLTKFWRNIAASHTHEEYQLHVKRMYESDDYLKNERVQAYFSQEWLSVHCRWVEAFLNKDFLSKLNTNNGVESQNKVLQHTFLTRQTEDKTLTSVLKVIVDHILPDALKEYSSCNAQINPDNRECYDSLPTFLRDRPLAFVEKVTLSYEKGRGYDITKMMFLGDGVFMVRNEMTMDNFDTVDFHQATCTCFDFSKWRLPCEHMCAVFACTDWGFERLPPWYRDSPYVTVDSKYSAVREVDRPSGSLADSNDGQCGPDSDDHEEVNELDHIIWGDEEESRPITPEVDMENSREKIRRDLKIILASTYLNHSASNIAKFAKSVDQLREKIESFSSQDAVQNSTKPIQKDLSRCHKL